MDITRVIDAQKEVWVDYPEADGVAFKLAYMGSDDYQDYVSGRMNRARRGRREVAADKQREIVCQAITKFILKDWKGLTQKDAEDTVPFQFTPENVKTLLEKSPLLRTFMIEEAADIDNFAPTDASDEETPEGELKSGD